MRDANAILRSVPGASMVAPQLRGAVQMVSLTGNASTTVIGATPDYAAVTNTSIDSGRMISDIDVRTSARVVVIGTTIVRNLFGTAEPIGQVVRINRVPFTVVGVLPHKGDTFGNDADNTAIVPITASRQRISGQNINGPDDIHVVYVSFASGFDLISAKKAIRATCLTYTDLPEAFGPVMSCMDPSRSTRMAVSFGTKVGTHSS